jgi:hypothetical protein
MIGLIKEHSHGASGRGRGGRGLSAFDWNWVGGAMISAQCVCLMTL